MKLSNYRESYYGFSGSASNVSRQAAFAGIALIWVFNSKTPDGIHLPIELIWPTLFLIIGLGLDLLHYVVASAIWGIFHRIKEKELGEIPDPDVEAPIYLNWPTLLLFWGKLIAICTGYIYLFLYAKGSIKFLST